MGWRDDIRRAVEVRKANPGLSGPDAMRLVDEQKSDERVSRYSEHYAPDAVETYIETVPAKAYKKDLNAFVRTYIAIVGLRPDDVFGIYPEPGRDVLGELYIVYRDRAEYAEGRSRFRRAVLDKR